MIQKYRQNMFGNFGVHGSPCKCPEKQCCIAWGAFAGISETRVYISKSLAGNPATVPDQVQDQDEDPDPEKEEEKEKGKR